MDVTVEAARTIKIHGIKNIVAFHKLMLRIFHA